MHSHSLRSCSTICLALIPVAGYHVHAAVCVSGRVTIGDTGQPASHVSVVVYPSSAALTARIPGVRTAGRYPVATTTRTLVDGTYVHAAGMSENFALRFIQGWADAASGHDGRFSAGDLLSGRYLISACVTQSGREFRVVDMQASAGEVSLLPMEISRYHPSLRGNMMYGWRFPSQECARGSSQPHPAEAK